ncbi:hypothetical protein GCM10023321_19870 [Pseudonocardia eucalypti]|uniref:HTH cro/C1-type domain-containing protein n=1 Tax=Pseudonocardia eucalypti TaxID=648755 RepID=A0ABP9PTH9_9PSEU|nr:DNA-binding XRE family transcriptional regulator [Pseudonocardia eucalypti]
MNSRRRDTEDQVHHRVAALRLERGLSRHQLAEALGLHPRTIGYLEQGEWEPSLAVALKIARLFDLPVEAIFSTPSRPRLLPVATPPGNIPDDAMSTGGAGLRGVGGDASRRARRSLTVGFLACLSAMPLAMAFLPESDGRLVSILAMFGGYALSIMLANAIRKLGAGHDGALDEIQRRVHDRYNSYAYLVLIRAYSVATVVILLFCWVKFELSDVASGASAVGIPLLFLVVSLPSLIVAWSLPDLDRSATGRRP